MGAQKPFFPVVVALAFACFSASSLLVRQSGFDVSLVTHYSSRVVEIAVCFLIAFVARGFKIDPQKILWVGVSALAVSLVFDYVDMLLPEVLFAQKATVFEIISGVFNGVQLACTVLLFARVLCFFSTRKTTIIILIGWTGSHAIFLLSFFLPQNSYFWMKLILTAIYAATLIFTLPRLEDSSPLQKKTRSRKTKLKLPPLLKETKYFSLYFSMLVFPFFYGFIAQICDRTGISFGLFDLSSEIVGVSFLLLLTITEPLWKKYLDVENIFIIIFPMFATAILCFSFFWESEIFISGFITKCGFLAYTVLMRVYLQKIIQKTPDRSFFFFGIAFGLYYGALMVGRLIAQILTEYEYAGLSSEIIATVSLYAIWLLSMAALLVFFINHKRRTKNAHESSNLETDFDHACKAFAEAYGLSERELTVIKEYAHGRTVGYIAQRMIVSEETIKTHLKRSYTKSSCHSRQELYDKIESFELKVLKEKPQRL